MRYCSDVTTNLCSCGFKAFFTEYNRICNYEGYCVYQSPQEHYDSYSNAWFISPGVVPNPDIKEDKGLK